MADTFTFTIKPITDLSDVKANVGEIQKAFSKLKLPDKLGEGLNKNIKSFFTEFEKYESKVKEGIKTSGDYRQVEGSLNKINSLYSEIVKDIQTISKGDLSDVFDLDSGEFKVVGDQIKEIVKQLENIKIDPNKITGPIEQLRSLIKNDKVSGKTGILNNLIGHIEKGELDEAKAALSDLEKYIKKVSLPEGQTERIVGKMTRSHSDAAQEALTVIQQVFTEAQNKGLPLEQTLNTLRQRFQDVQDSSANSLRDFTTQAGESVEATESLVSVLQKAHKEDFNFDNQVKSIDRQIQSYFGLGQMIRKVGNIAREAFKTIQELDAAMTETAVVTNFSVGDMWEKLPLYTQQANALGSSIKDVYEATTLYYQQGLNTTQSMGLAVETLKMARIAGMDAKDATDAMTAALRGFNLELNQASAQRINDVYSELAAITASDTQEISTAMEKVASLAHNAGMELETTSAFLAQMIETTREAPENLGTALKTVVARFQEMKQDPTKLIDSEGVMLDANKVDKALKSIGVNLLNTNGEFRKLDDVFLEIASKWDTLSMGQQRYIATMAAGSRQQSRFIAMMSNYSRTMELVDAAYDSSGASQRQFEKTLESLDAKLNKLRNAWNEFAMGLMNDELLKSGVDLLTAFIDKINDFVDLIGRISPDPFKGVTKSLTTLILTLGGLGTARKVLSRGIESGVGWFKGEMSGSKALTNFFFSPKNAIAEAKVAKEAGDASGTAFSIAYTNARDRILKQKPFVPTLAKNGEVLNYKQVAGMIGEGTGQQQEALRQYQREEISKKDFAKQVGLSLNKDGEFVKGAEVSTSKIAQFSQGVQSAGVALQSFGNILQGTPLAPFGKIVSTTGMLLSNFGVLIAKAATTAAVGVTTASGATVTGIRAIGIAITQSPLFPFVIALMGLVAVGTLIYRVLTKDKREMETLAEAAKASSDAFDNLKTSTEELKNSINDIRNSDSLFDGLVVGTTEWNLALVEANQQVLDLIKKYPMLQKYMTTDANGRMSISEAGFKAVQEEQNKKLGQAQALDILTNAEHNSKLLEQEQKKIFKDEKITNTVAVTYEFDENGASTMKTALVDSYEQLSEEGQQEWDSIQAKIDAESAAAREQAVRAALSANGELNNTIISLFGQNLEEVEKQFEGETNLDTIKYAYAEFIGGVYDPLTKALTDASGEDVNLSDDALKQIYPQIMALLKFQDEAPQVESAIKSLGQSFDSLFENREGSTFINDLLDNNLEADASAINKFLDMSDTEIEKVLENISDEEVKAIMQSDTAQKSDLINLLKTNADNLKQAQTQSYKDATVWYAKTVKKWGSVTAKVGAMPLASAITKGLTIGSADAINNFMNQMSQSFDSAALSTMGESLFGALLGEPDDIQQELVGIVNNVDWSSAIERGKFYEEFAEGSEAFEKLNADGQKFVKTTKQVDKGLDLTGKQFEELVQSSDFLEILTEKWSDFADESGKVDATGIREMAKECGTLSKVLNLAEFDADNLAMALNYFQQTGSFDGITGAVIAAAKEFNSLDKLIDDVKQDVEGFKPGENYDQGMDAYRGYMKSLKEGYENRQYSDADTLSYAHRFVNSSEWKDYARAHGGSNKSAEKEIIDSLETIFTENEEDTTINILNRLASGKTLLGGQAKESDVFSAYYNDEGQLKLDIDPTTTRKAFIKALVEERGFTEEMARAFTLSLEGQDWGFIDDNLTDAFNKAGRDSGIAEYIQGIRDRGLISSLGQSTQGNTVISQAELEAIQSMGGYETLDEVVNDIATSLGVLPETIKYFNTETQNAVDFLKLKFGENANIQDSAREFLKVEDGVGNFNQATEQLQQSGIDATAALELAVQMAQEAGIEQVRWGKDLVNVSDVINGDQFNEAVEKLNEDQHWQDVGKILGDAVATALAEAGIGNGPQNNDTDNTEGSNNSSDFTIPDIKAEIMSQFSADKIQSQLDEATKGITANFEAGLEVDKTNAFEGISEVKQEAEKQVVMPVDADTKNAVTKDGILVSQIEQEVTKQVNADTVPAQTAVNELDQRASQPVFKTIHATITGLTQKLKDILGLAKGQNNYISPSGFYTGSAAKGVKGTLGPTGKGGLTLTGEEGFEIAWLPSEGRAMILGAAGPQMTNLPSDAVVYTHEQSKKIVKQKGISTGSAYGGTYDTPSGAINVNIVGDQTSGSGSGSGSSSSSEKDLKRTNWYKEEITRYNLNQSINKITAEIERTTKSIEKSLDKLGTKYSDIANDVGEQANLIQQNIENQKKLRDSFQAQLNLLDNGGRSLWMDIIDSAGESSQKSISTEQFVYKDKDGSYKVDKNKVISYAASLGGDSETQKVNAETIFNTIQSELSNLSSGLLAATKAIRDAQDEYDTLIQKVADAFYAWENELTKLYDLTNRMNEVDGRRARLTSETAMLLARVEAGFISVGKAGEYLARVQADGAELLTQQIELSRENVKTRREELNALLSSSDEKNEYDRIYAENQKLIDQGKYTGEAKVQGDAREKAAWEKYIASALMNSYVKQTQNQDGTFTFDFNEEQLEKDRQAGKISQKTYEAIKEGYDKMVEKNEELNEAIAQAADDMAEVYETYNDHLQTMADLESKLTDAFEAAAKQEVSKLEVLNTSLTNASKAILDQVKKNIQARRQAEDNAKTERDIAKKQQRLAVLRANTGGGNQVEIAQLEKEIGEAQSSYGRTLEDQLMANMQSQADEASKQRQEQIDLAKQQIDYNRQTGLYAAEADKLLADVQGNQQTIQDILHSTQTETLGEWNQKVQNGEIKKQVTEAIVAEDAIPALKEVITNSGNALAASISAWNANMMKVDEKGTTNSNKNDKGISTVGKTDQPGHKEPEKDPPKAPSNPSSSTPKETYPYGYASKTTGLLDYGTNQYGYNQVKAVQYALRKMGYKGKDGKELTIDGEYGVNTKYAVTNFQKAMGITADGIVGNDTRAKFKAKGYKKGGLANYTGPAWLDGTPTKPELVLNAQDTKNFIALKDILSGVMRSISHTDTSNIYNSPTNFEINVNVEKIASDYDVDKLTERIKRNIVKDATYRNVTSVRKFK